MAAAGNAKCAIIIKKFLEGTGCGIPETQRKLYEAYVPFIQTLAKEHNLDEDMVFNNVAATAIKPILRFKKNDSHRKDAEKHIVETLKKNLSPTHKSIEAAMEIIPIPKHQRDPHAAVKEWKTPQMVLSSKPQSSVSEKNRAFRSILTPGMIQVWKDYATRHNLDNEYAALSKVTTLLKDL